MIHSTSLLFASSLVIFLLLIVNHSAAVKDCSGKLHFDPIKVLDNREIFSHRKASSLEECVKICYSKSEFCFSVIFKPTQDNWHHCLLSYKAAYMCSKRNLTDSYTDLSKPVVIECIRCTNLGDKVHVKAIKTANERERVEENVQTDQPRAHSTQQPVETVSPTVIQIAATVDDDDVVHETRNEIPEKMTETEQPSTQETTVATTTAAAVDADETISLDKILDSEVAFATGDSGEVGDGELTEHIEESIPTELTAETAATLESITKAKDRSDMTTVTLEMSSFLSSDQNENSATTSVPVSTAQSTKASTVPPVTTVQSQGTQKLEVSIVTEGQDLSSGASGLLEAILTEPVEQGSVSDEISDSSYPITEKNAEMTSASSTASDITAEVAQSEERTTSYPYTHVVKVDFEEITFTERMIVPVDHFSEQSENTVPYRTRPTAEKVTESIEYIKKTSDGVAFNDDQLTTEANNNSVATEKLEVEPNKAVAAGTIEQAIADGRNTCEDMISFIPRVASSQSRIVYSQEESTKTVEHCAVRCYERRCTSGVYIKEILPGELGSCLMAFGEELCDLSNDRVFNYTGHYPVEIHCIRCDYLSIDSKPKVIKTNTADQIKNEKPVSIKQEDQETNSKVLYKCNETLSFEVAEPNQHSKRHFTDHKFATSVGDCAKQCYEAGCAIAGFTMAHLPNEPSFCLMSYKPDTCNGGKRYTEYTVVDNPVQIQCIRCGQDSVLQSSPSSDASTDITESTDAAAEYTHEDVIPSTLSETPNLQRECSGKITFQSFKPGDDFNVSFTSDHRSSSAADCARQCYKKGDCHVSAFVAPPKGLSSGVCLLSEEASICKPDSPALIQHYSVSPFVMSCFKCSRCNFNARNFIPTQDSRDGFSSYFDEFEIQVDAADIVECAEKCHSKKCTLAAYSAQSISGNCLMTIKADRKCDDEITGDSFVDTEGTLPVLIDCVQCA